MNGSETEGDIDLVVQGPSLSESDVAWLVDLARASGHERLHAAQTPAFRLLSPAFRDGVIDACAARGLDAAFVPRDRRLDRVRVVAMDMDSTLITIECIDEIADMQGIKPQISVITASAMRGEIDFRESLTRRVALLRGLPVDSLARVYDERLRLSPGAERMLSRFRAVGARTLLVSGGFTFFTSRLKERLSLDDVLANELEIRDGRLTGRIAGAFVDGIRKAEALARLKAEHAAGEGIVLAIGDGANDLPLLREADVSVAYHAKPIVRAQTTHAIDRCGLDAILNLFV